MLVSLTFTINALLDGCLVMTDFAMHLWRKCKLAVVGFALKWLTMHSRQSSHFGVASDGPVRKHARTITSSLVQTRGDRLMEYVLRAIATRGPVCHSRALCKRPR